MTARRPAEAYPFDTAIDAGHGGWNVINSRGQTILPMVCIASAKIVRDTSNNLNREADRHNRKARRVKSQFDIAYHTGVVHGLRWGIQELRDVAEAVDHGDDS